MCGSHTSGLAQVLAFVQSGALTPDHMPFSAPRRVLFASLYSAVSTGAFYSFGLYSNALKKQFHLSQQELVNINTIPYIVRQPHLLLPSPLAFSPIHVAETAPPCSSLIKYLHSFFPARQNSVWADKFYLGGDE